MEAWLKRSENSVTVESLFLHELCYALGLAAARSHYALGMLTVDVDRFGWDVALDDGTEESRLQLKVVAKTSKTRKWKVTKRLLRPKGGMPDLGFERSAEGEGLGGGLLVTTWTQTPEGITTRYSFANALTLVALEQTIIGTPAQQAGAKRLLQGLRRGSGRERILVPRTALVTPKGPDELLALAGLQAGPPNSNLLVNWHLLRARATDQNEQAAINGTLKEDFERLL